MLSKKQRMAYVGLLVVLMCIAFIPLTHSAGGQLSQMLKITLTVYAIARGLNAVISVAKGTEVSIEPLGVGLTLTPGEILDPLNDLIEQFSLVLLIASASLGIQQILLAVGDINAFRWLIAGLALLTIILLFTQWLTPLWQRKLISIVVILSLLRLLVPMTALVSHQAQQWLSADRQAALVELEAARSEVETITLETPATEKRWFQSIRDNFDVTRKLSVIEERAERGVEAAIYLLAEFVLIMLLIPLAFIFIMFKLFGRISRYK